MLVETGRYRTVLLLQAVRPGVLGANGGKALAKVDDVESSMHACQKHIRLSGDVRMPFGTPDSAANGYLPQGLFDVSCIEESKMLIITGREIAIVIRALENEDHSDRLTCLLPQDARHGDWGR